MLFGKDATASGESKLNSIIGKGSTCQGDIVVAGGVKIDGNFKGTVKAEALYVGKDAVVEATVDTNVAIIGGRVLGDVIARQSLELQAKAELVGNVITKTLIVAETAVLDGYCDMGRKERHAQKPQPSKEGAAPGAHGPVPGPGSPATGGVSHGQPAAGAGGQPIRPAG